MAYPGALPPASDVEEALRSVHTPTRPEPLHAPTARPSFPLLNHSLLPGPIIKGGAGGGELHIPLLPG